MAEAGDDPDLESSEEQLYFLAIEKVFLEERGSPLYLSPKDWHLARKWYEEGIPLDWVERTLRELFEKRRAKGTAEKVINLGYCKRSVEAAWKRYLKMGAPEVEAVEIDVAARLAALARALPPGLEGRGHWSDRIVGLEGGPEQVEEQLGELDREIFESVREGLGDETREQVRRKVDGALANLARRLPPKELAGVEAQLTERVLREHLALPVLSLFALEAAAEGADTEPDDRTRH